jgi:hypothetical protein
MTDKDLLRFWSKVGFCMGSDPAPCWEWLGSKSRLGYGRFKLPGKNATASRVFYEHLTGRTLPRGVFVCHTCDNPGCVRPSHLFAGTAADNNRDMSSKGRVYRCGSALPVGVKLNTQPRRTSPYMARQWDIHSRRFVYLGVFATVEAASEALRIYRETGERRFVGPRGRRRS